MKPKDRHFACPVCFRLTTQPWDEAWCSCATTKTIQPFNPADRKAKWESKAELQWTQMVEISEPGVQAAIIVSTEPICPDCGGDGERVINEDWPSGDAPYSEKCSTCVGKGELR